MFVSSSSQPSNADFMQPKDEEFLKSEVKKALDELALEKSSPEGADLVQFIREMRKVIDNPSSVSERNISGIAKCLDVTSSNLSIHSHSTLKFYKTIQKMRETSAALKELRPSYIPAAPATFRQTNL